MSISSAASTTSGTLGDAPPVSFPGVASGIDYTAIIEKYTAQTLQAEKPLEAQVSNINNQNTAVLKIKNLLGSVQDSLTSLSDPTIFGAYKATPSNTADGSTAATFTQVTGQTPIAGTYTINAQKAATATTITNNSTVANSALNTTSFLDEAGTSITASNGTGSSGAITINGVQVKYDVTSQSLSTILAAIKSQVNAVSGNNINYAINADGTVTLTGVTSIGSGADSGNLEQVLKLDTAQLNSAGINATSPLASAGLATAPVSGTVVVNGVSVSYNAATDSLSTILGNIQSQTAGTVAIGSAGLATAPTSGNIVVNGTAVAYTTGQSLNTILANITAATGVSATLSGGKVTIGSAGTPLTSIADSGGGNLVEALNLTGAITAGATTSTTALSSGIGVTSTINYESNTVTLNGLTSLADGTGNLLESLDLTGAITGGSTTSTAALTGNASIVTSSSAINGINENATLGSSSNGFATPVTAGKFTINGVSFTVNPSTESLSDLINQINSSSAGVVAQYNTSTSQFTLTSSAPGAESILLGASGDVSNFLQAVGLTNSSGATIGTTVAGTQASLTYTANNATHTVYSSTNTFNNVVPGFSLQVTDSSPSTLAPGSTYYTVTVASDPTKAEAAINTFVKAYNAAITELNTDLAAPTVSAGTTSSDGLATSTSHGGGILYGNFQVEELKNQLVSIVSGFIPSGSAAYNSLSTIGLNLNTASQTVGEQSDSTDSTDSTTSSTSDSGLTVTGGTDGTLAALDTTTFEAAYAANTAAVQALFTLTPPSTPSNQTTYTYTTQASGFAYQLGTFVSNSNGLTTFLKNSAITPTDLSNILLTTVEDANNQQIDSLEQEITQITTEANNQANQLRSQFSASESQIAELQSLQSQIAAIGH